MEEKPKSKRGGARPNSGRPTKYAETKVIRIPSQYEKAIRALVAHLDATQMIDRHYTAVSSEPMFMRSLQDKAQEVIFTTRPKAKS